MTHTPSLGFSVWGSDNRALTVKTLTKVEAFALTADKWKILVSRRSQAASIAKRFAQATRGCLNEKMNEIKFSQNGLA
jgi:hypothetical protein